MSSAPLELIAVEVKAEVDQAEKSMNGLVSVADRSMGSVERSVVKAEQGIVRSSRSIAAAQQNLGRQFADIGAQLASGSSPLLILAQQAPQVADAMSGMEGKAASVARFFSGPWGAALLAAGSVLGIVIQKALESGETVESMTKKLEENAAKAKMGAAAQTIFEQSLYGAADASEKLNKRLQEQNRTQLQTAQSALALAEATRQANLQNLQKELRDAQTQRARLENIQAGRRRGSLLSTPESQAADDAAAAVYADRLAKATEREKVAREGLANAEKAVVEARIPLLDMKAVAASDESAAATRRHDEALGNLREEYRKTGDESAYLAGRTRIEKQLSEDQAAIKTRESNARKAETAAKREEAKAARELEKAQRELESSLKAITAAFDPAKAAAQGFRDTLAEIDKLQRAGLISGLDAMAYKLKAASEQAKAIAEQAAKDSEAGFLAVGIRPGEMDGSEVRDQINRDLQLREDANQQIADDYKRKQEAQIRNLAGLYETLFRDGTGGIWRDFKQIGLRVIAEVLARFTLSQLGGGGGGIDDIVGASIGAVLGFASGGSGTFGGRGGTDQNVLSLNGRPIANVSRGESFSIGTRAARGGGSGQVIQPIIQVDARGAVMNDQFAQMILAQANQGAIHAAASMGQAINKNIPNRLAQFQRDGT